MTRLILAALVGTTAILATSCGCCTSDVEAPPLRQVVVFREIPT